jgi:hypothetical protein
MSGNSNRFWSVAAGSVLMLAAALSVALPSCKTHVFTPRQGWNNSYGPVVPHDEFPADCAICHTGGNWTTITRDFEFDHEAKTGVPLLGAHQFASCLMCHNDRGPAGDFAARGCAGCHPDPHRGRLGAMCSDCHEEDTWQAKEPIAKHNRTRFPLVGAHASVACFACHPGAQVNYFSGANTQCVACHQADLVKAVSPNHVQLNFSTECQQCHVPTGWKPAYYKHPPSFPLTGGHSGVDCASCHTGGVYTGLSTDCASCHMDDYQATTDPNHAAAAFSTECQTCHTTRSWQGARYNHPPSFPLTAGHSGQSCSSCHVGGVYTGLSTDCASCHTDDYQATTDPNHITAGFGTDCKTCHSTTSWQGATFNHPASFPLTGGHSGQSCSSCHVGGVYTGLSTDCASCHTDDYQATTDPNHVAAGFGTDCQTCHSTTSWQGAKFTHTFPISSGPHKVACAECHLTPGNYAVYDCTHCHTKAVTDEHHNEVSGYQWTSTACYQCHPNGKAGD